MIDWNQYETEKLASIHSDYHKDVHGFRPRWSSGTEEAFREALIDGLKSLDRYMDVKRSTPAGRAQLREEGWHVEEPTT